MDSDLTISPTVWAIVVVIGVVLIVAIIAVSFVNCLNFKLFCFVVFSI